jgi:hypothetical protein
MEQYTSNFEFLVYYLIPFLIAVVFLVGLFTLIMGFRNFSKELVIGGIVGITVGCGIGIYFFLFAKPEMLATWEIVRKLKQRENPSYMLVYISLIPLVLLGIRSAFKLRTSK